MAVICSSCHVKFAESSSYRDHCKSEWHVFNVRRITNGRTPVTRELYLKRLRILEETKNEKIKKVDHIKQKDEVMQEKKERPHFITDEEEYKMNYSIFDTQASPDYESNLEYMKLVHKFTIPDEKYLEKQFNDEMTGEQALIYYLGIKVWMDNLCIYCNKKFKGAQGVQEHMESQGHKMINFTKESVMNEYLEFYDYSDSYLYSNMNQADKDRVQAERIANPDKDVNEIMEDLGLLTSHLTDNGDLLLPSGEVLMMKENSDRDARSKVDVEAIVSVVDQSKRMRAIEAPVDEPRRARAMVDREKRRQHNMYLGLQSRGHKLTRYTCTATTYLMNNTGH